MISIVLPFFNKFDLTHQRLHEIFSFLPKETEVVLVDDASTENDSLGLISWWQKKIYPGYGRETLRYIRNETNLGFGGSMNRGVRHARGNIIVLLSNDVIVRGDFTKQIEEYIRLDSHILIGGRIIDWRGGWNEFNFDGHDTLVPYCEGWFLACTKDVWDELGGFDPIYGRFDYEDVDLSMTAWSKGIKLVGMNSPFLTHLGSQTISGLSVDRMEHTKKNREKFIEKWKEAYLNLIVEKANVERETIG